MGTWLAEIGRAMSLMPIGSAGVQGGGRSGID